MRRSSILPESSLLGARRRARAWAPVARGLAAGAVGLALLLGACGSVGEATPAASGTTARPRAAVVTATPAGGGTTARPRATATAPARVARPTEGAGLDGALPSLALPTLPPAPTRAPTATPTPRPTATPAPPLPPSQPQPQPQPQNPGSSQPQPQPQPQNPAPQNPAPPPPPPPPPTATPRTRNGVTAPEPGCEIKAIVQANGDKVYYKPGWQGYDRLIVNVDQGGRWFCNEDDVKAAGFRAPRQ